MLDSYSDADKQSCQCVVIMLVSQTFRYVFDGIERVRAVSSQNHAEWLLLLFGFSTIYYEHGLKCYRLFETNLVLVAETHKTFL